MELFMAGVKPTWSVTIRNSKTAEGGLLIREAAINIVPVPAQNYIDSLSLGMLGTFTSG